MFTQDVDYEITGFLTIAIEPSDLYEYKGNLDAILQSHEDLLWVQDRVQHNFHEYEVVGDLEFAKFYFGNAPLRVESGENYEDVIADIKAAVGSFEVVDVNVLVA